jgi:hypothetical protein
MRTEGPAPKGLQDSAQGFNPANHHSKGARETALVKVARLSPFQGETLIEWFPGLKPWAEGL